MTLSKTRLIGICLVAVLLAGAGFGLYKYRGSVDESSTKAAEPREFTVSQTSPGNDSILGVGITCSAREVLDQFGSVTAWNVTITGENIDVAKKSTGVKIHVPWNTSIEGQDRASGQHQYMGSTPPTVVASAETFATTGFAGSLVQCDLPIPGAPAPTGDCPVWTEDRLRSQFEGFAPLGTFDHPQRPTSVVEGGQEPVYVRLERSADKSRVTGTVTNGSHDCMIVSLVVYKMYDNKLQNQKYFAGVDNIMVPGNSQKTVSAPLPTCMAQIDFFGTPVAPRTLPASSLDGPPFMGAAFHLNKTNLFEQPDGPLCSDTPTDADPIGNFDLADCIKIVGWAMDKDVPTQSLDVHVYRDGAAGQGVFVGSFRADKSRPDVNDALKVSGNHGFDFPTPQVFKDGASHTIYIYAINPVSGKINPLLQGSPKTIFCPLTPPPAGQTDVGIEKSVSPSLILVGQNATFIVTVKNHGPLPATSVTVTDTLPAGLTLLSNTPSVGTFTTSTNTWNVGSLAVGEQRQLSLVVRGDSAGTRINKAVITQVNPTDSNPANNEAQATLTVVAPAVPELVCAPGTQSIYLNQSATFAAVGGTGTYSWSASEGTPAAGNGSSFTTQFVSTGTKSVKVTSGAKEAVCTVVVSSVPVVTPQLDLAISKEVSPAVIFVGQSAAFTVRITNRTQVTASSVTVSDVLPQGISYTSHGASQGSYVLSSGVWNVGSLAASASATLTFQVSGTIPGSFTNLAEIRTATPQDSDSTNNSATATLIVQNPNVPNPLVCSISKNIVEVNQVVTAWASGGNGSYIWAAPTGLPQNGSGASFSTGFTAPGQHTISVQSGNSTAQCVVTAYSPVTYQPRADLSLKKMVSPGSIAIGSKAIFTLVLINDGPNAAQFVAVKDILPAGLAYESSVAARGSYDAGSGVWTVGDIEVGEQLTLLITVKGLRAGSYTNFTEVISSSVPDPDSTPGNGNIGEDDDASVSLEVTGGLANAGVPLLPIGAFGALCALAAFAAIRIRTAQRVRLQTPVGETLVDFE